MEPEEKKLSESENLNPLETLVKEEHSGDKAAESKVDDKKTEKAGESRFKRLKHWYKTHKKISIPATLVLLLAVVAAIPWSRYQTAGLVYKKDFTLQLKDSTAKTPVSGAKVSIGRATAITDGDGKVTLSAVKVGNHKANISKKYYQDSQVNVLVPILNQKNTPSFSVVAIGRQTKVLVTNLINDDKLEGVEIEAAGTVAKTDKDGAATVVLPAGADKQKAKLKLSGYNPAEVEIEVSSSETGENTFKLTPAGRIYFMSKRTGKLDVMKVNLDGSDAKVAVSGTGSEQDDNTRLIQSPDGKHVALVARRSATEPTAQLYVLAAEDDKLTSADTGNAEFSLVGWSGSRLVYIVTRNDLAATAAGKSKLKSYDANSGRITSLDQTEEGDPAVDARLRYDFVRLVGDTVVFAKTWFGNTTALAGKMDSFNIIGAGGGNHKTVATYDTAANFMSYSQHSPVGFYIRQSVQASGEEKFFDYTIGATPKPMNINITQFYEDNYSYLFSPSGRQSLWSEVRDGENAFLVADSSGMNPKVVESLDGFSPESWFTDQYLLLSFKSRELYIMSAKGGVALKVTNYQSTYTFY